MTSSPFFLHIKKAGGQATRKMLQPYYVEVDRRRNPGTFVQSRPEQFNDILNNFRVVIGDYQFRRALFAKTFLFPEDWDGMCSFAFSREPMSRCLSMYHYILARGSTPRERLRAAATNGWRYKRVWLSPRGSFDFFLDNVEAARTSGSIYAPLGLHFSTHTAPVWGDVTDDHGDVLLRHVFRLENLVPALNQVFEECDLDQRLDRAGDPVNKSGRRRLYEPTPAQRRRVEQIYAQDFELYESAEQPH